MKNQKMYEADDQMISLIRDNYNILQSLGGFGLSLGFGVIAQRLGEADLARCLAEGLEAMTHCGQFDIRRINHGDLRLVDATFLGPLPVAVQRVKCVLAATGTEHPVDGIAPGIAHTVAVVGVAVAPGLSFADPAFHAPSSSSSSSRPNCRAAPAKAASQRRLKSG